MRRVSVLATLLCLAAGPAAAQFYVGVHGGLNIASDSDLEFQGIDLGMAEFDSGPTFGGVAGFGYCPWRFEGEVTYRENDIEDFVVGGVSLKSAGVNIDGDVTSLAAMANGWYDFSSESLITPYVGGGIGAVFVEADSSAAIPGFGFISGSSEDTAFGMQVGGGVAVSVARRIEATLDYRYLFTAGLDLDGLEADYDNHSVRVGLRFRL